MTTQDLYFGIQMGLQLLIGGGVVWAAVWLSGVLKRAIEGQEKTIAAQAELMKAQSTVLQDVERFNKIMQQVIDFVDPQAQLQREQAYRDRVDRELKVLEDEMAKMREEWVDAQTMARDMLLQLNKASDGWESSIASLREATLELQEGSIVMEDARLVMQEQRAILEENMKLQKLKGKTPEDKTRDQPRSSPRQELTDAAKTDCTSNNQS
jgi:hypothetical protein